MQSLLLLLFALVVPYSQPPTQLQVINEEWETHAEGFEAAMKLPAADEKVYIEIPLSNQMYRGMGNGTTEVEQWRPLVAGQFPPEQLENALCVIRSESGGNMYAKNPRSNARGLFQVMSSIWGPEFDFSHEDFYIPELNVYAAARIWERSGWVPWSPRTRRNCGL